MATTTNELSAVNDMLSSIGEAPFNTLEGATTASVAIARNVLANETSKLQARGWHFNTDHEYPLVPTASGEIILPDNMVQVDVAQGRFTGTYDPVIREGKLYDRNSHSFKWTETIYADVRWIFPFEDLPEIFRQYVTIRASRQFMDRMVGADTLVVYTQDDEYRAWANCLAEEAEQADYNFFANGEIAQTFVR